jgi:hypothetical protein
VFRLWQWQLAQDSAGLFAFLAAFLRRMEQMVPTSYMYDCVVKVGREKKIETFYFE